VARNQQSHTGKYLARVLNGGRNGNGNGGGANHGNHATAPADAAVPDLPTE
jgi:hypothetical protein